MPLSKQDEEDKIKSLLMKDELLTNAINDLNRVANLFGDTEAITQVRSHLHALALQTLTELIKAGWKGDRNEHTD